MPIKGNSAVKDVTAHARQMLPAPELFLCSPNVNSSLGIMHVLYAGKEQLLCSPALLQHGELFRSANFLPRSSKLITYVCGVLLLPSQVNTVLVREDIYSSLEARTNCSSAEKIDETASSSMLLQSCSTACLNPRIYFIKCHQIKQSLCKMCNL